MALFPKIQSPCPYKGDVAALLDGDVCRLCKKQVHDITALSDAGRVAFFDACNGAEVCVTYRVPVAAAALAAAAMLLPTSAAACDATGSYSVETGGMRDTKNVQYVQRDPADRATPDLPVVYETSAKAEKPATVAKAS